MITFVSMMTLTCADLAIFGFWAVVSRQQNHSWQARDINWKYMCAEVSRACTRSLCLVSKIKGKASWSSPVTYRKLIMLIAQTKTYLLSVHPFVCTFIPSHSFISLFHFPAFNSTYAIFSFYWCVICGMRDHVCHFLITHTHISHFA